MTVGDIRRRDLVRFDQGHMSYVLDPGARKREVPEIKKLVLGIPGNVDFDIDMDDTLNRFPIPRSLRYEEVADSIRVHRGKLLQLRYGSCKVQRSSPGTR